MTEPDDQLDVSADDYTEPPDMAPMLAEPDDHTTLAVRDQRNRLRIIWRDDDTAARCRTTRTPTDARWFDGGVVPTTWAKILDDGPSRTIAVYDLVCTATPWQAARGAETVYAGERPGVTDVEAFSREAMRRMPLGWQRQFAVLADQYRRHATATQPAAVRALNVGDEVDDLVSLVAADHRGKGFSRGHGTDPMRNCADPMCCQATLVHDLLFPRAAAARRAARKEGQ